MRDIMKNSHNCWFGDLNTYIVVQLPSVLTPTSIRHLFRRHKQFVPPFFLFNQRFSRTSHVSQTSSNFCVGYKSHPGPRQIPHPIPWFTSNVWQPPHHTKPTFNPTTELASLFFFFWGGAVTLNIFNPPH